MIVKIIFVKNVIMIKSILCVSVAEPDSTNSRDSLLDQMVPDLDVSLADSISDFLNPQGHMDEYREFIGSDERPVDSAGGSGEVSSTTGGISQNPAGIPLNFTERDSIDSLADDFDMAEIDRFIQELGVPSPDVVMGGAPDDASQYGAPLEPSGGPVQVEGVPSPSGSGRESVEPVSEDDEPVIELEVLGSPPTSQAQGLGGGSGSVRSLGRAGRGSLRSQNGTSHSGRTGIGRRVLSSPRPRVARNEHERTGGPVDDRMDGDADDWECGSEVEEMESQGRLRKRQKFIQERREADFSAAKMKRKATNAARKRRRKHKKRLDSLESEPSAVVFTPATCPGCNARLEFSLAK